MRRLCEKPGCGAPAEASYGIDQVRLVVWVDELEVAERESAGRLCRRHADALEGPRGWTTDDRRQPVPTLFRSRNTADDTKDTPRARGQRKKPVVVVDTPSLFESIRRELESTEAPATPAAEPEPGSDVTTDPGVDPEETKAIPWSPNIGRGSPGEKDPTRPVGRLLGRAFGDQETDE